MHREPTTEELLESKGHLLVRSVMNREGAVRDALIDFMAPEGDYTLEEWNAFLRTLDRSPDRVADMLEEA